MHVRFVEKHDFQRRMDTDHVQKIVMRAACLTVEKKYEIKQPLMS